MGGKNKTSGDTSPEIINYLEKKRKRLETVKKESQDKIQKIDDDIKRWDRKSKK